MSRVDQGWRGGTPEFVEDLNQKACIGCGRCYKVCPQGVLNMIGITEDGDIVDAQDDDAEKKVMSIANGENCIGCQSCSKVCGKSCFTHSSKARDMTIEMREPISLADAAAVYGAMMAGATDPANLDTHVFACIVSTRATGCADPSGRRRRALSQPIWTCCWPGISLNWKRARKLPAISTLGVAGGWARGFRTSSSRRRSTTCAPSCSITAPLISPRHPGWHPPSRGLSVFRPSPAGSSPDQPQRPFRPADPSLPAVGIQEHRRYEVEEILL